MAFAANGVIAIRSEASEGIAAPPTVSTKFATVGKSLTEQNAQIQHSGSLSHFVFKIAFSSVAFPFSVRSPHEQKQQTTAGAKESFFPDR